MSGIDEQGPRDEAEERDEAENPEAFWRRREFLAKTAALAGVAGLATVLPSDTLLSLASRKQTARSFPSARNMPLDTVVVLMMENRSFDHYFGSFEGADGRNKGISYPGADGKMHPTHYLPPDYQGCGFDDPDHSFDGGRTQYNGGKLDGFYETSDEFALGYYLEKDVGFLAPAAKAYMTYDRYFCSILSSTYPNRHYMISAQCGRSEEERAACDLARQPVGDDLRPGQGARGQLRLLRRRPAGPGALRGARAELGEADRAVLYRRGSRYSAADRLCRPALSRRRRR